MTWTGRWRALWRWHVAGLRLALGRLFMKVGGRVSGWGADLVYAAEATAAGRARIRAAVRNACAGTPGGERRSPDAPPEPALRRDVLGPYP